MPSNSSDYTTISITKEALELLKGAEIKFHGLTVKDNSSKIIALMKLYEENFLK